MVAMKQRRWPGSRAGLDLINGSGSSVKSSSSTSGSILSPLLFGLSSEHPRIDLLMPAQALEASRMQQYRWLNTVIPEPRWKSLISQLEDSEDVLGKPSASMPQPQDSIPAVLLPVTANLPTTNFEDGNAVKNKERQSIKEIKGSRASLLLGEKKELGKKITYLEFHKIKISQVMGQLWFASFFHLMKRNI
jgi:hypothetical protein